MTLAITLNGSAGPLLSAKIGSAVALSEASSFAGVSAVTWELTRPPGSAVALSVSGLIGAAPFTNSFTPDIPGNYLVRMVAVLTAGGSVDVSTVARVADPFVLGTLASQPAPGEQREVSASVGWADEATAMLRAGRLHMSGNAYVTAYNGAGAPLASGTVVRLSDVIAYPTMQGGAIVPGAPVDYVARAYAVGAIRRNLAWVLDAIPADGRAVALRRGVVVSDTSGYTAGDILYLHPTSGNLTTTPTPYPVAQVLRSATTTANPPGLIHFDPRAAEDLQPGWYKCTLGAVGLVATDVDAWLQWTAASTYAVIVDYMLRVGTDPDVQVGRLYISIRNAAVAECIVDRVAGSTTVVPGVTFTGVVSAGTAKLQFTNTGASASMEYFIQHVGVIP